MLTRADIAAALDNGYALGLLILVGALLATCLISAVSHALWLRFGASEQVEALELDGGAR